MTRISSAQPGFDIVRRLERESRQVRPSVESQSSEFNAATESVKKRISEENKAATSLQDQTRTPFMADTAVWLELYRQTGINGDPKP